MERPINVELSSWRKRGSWGLEDDQRVYLSSTFIVIRHIGVAPALPLQSQRHHLETSSQRCSPPPSSSCLSCPSSSLPAGSIFSIPLSDLPKYAGPGGTSFESPKSPGSRTSGSGPYPAQMPTDSTLPVHTIFVPKVPLTGNLSMPFIA